METGTRVPPPETSTRSRPQMGVDASIDKAGSSLSVPAPSAKSISAVPSRINVSAERSEAE